MKNRDDNNDAIPTSDGEKEFLDFVTQTDVPSLSKFVRELYLYYDRTHMDKPLTWAESLLNLHSLFQLFDSVEAIYF